MTETVALSLVPAAVTALPEVSYLHNELHPDRVEAAVRQVWQAIRSGQVELALLNVN